MWPRPANQSPTQSQSPPPLAGCLWDDWTLQIIVHSFYRVVLMDAVPYLRDVSVNGRYSHPL